MIRRLFRKLFFPEKKLHDEFIVRLRTALTGEGMLRDGNLYAFDYALQRLPKEGAMLEIGSFGGMSTNILVYLARKHRLNHPFFTCDPWIYEGFHDTSRSNDPVYMQKVDGFTDLTRKDYMDHIRQKFILDTRFFSGDRLPRSISTDSDTFFEMWRAGAETDDVFGRKTALGGDLAFCYIDGNHAYDYARRDALHCLEFLLPGGFMLLDDSADHLQFGSVRLARELCRDQRIKLVMKNPNYLFVRI